jgi:hypothetical protein
VLAKKLLRGDIADRGAKACVGLIDLKEIAAELAEFDIGWQVNEERDPCSPPT